MTWVVRARATPEAAGEIADALARRPDTSWIDMCSGGTEIVGAAHGTGVETLLLDALPHTRHVVDVRADQILRTFCGGPGQPFPKHGPLTPQQITQLAEHLPAPIDSPERVNAVDQRLRAALRRDGRASIEDVTTAASMSGASVRRRLHALRASGALHLDVDINLDLLGLPVRTLLWLHVDVADIDSVASTIASHGEVAFAAAITGPANIFATVSTPDTAALYRYLTERVAIVSGVAHVETTPVLRHVKAAITHYAARSAHGARAPQRK